MTCFTIILTLILLCTKPRGSIQCSPAALRSQERTRPKSSLKVPWFQNSYWLGNWKQTNDFNVCLLCLFQFYSSTKVHIGSQKFARACSESRPTERAVWHSTIKSRWRKGRPLRYEMVILVCLFRGGGCLSRVGGCTLPLVGVGVGSVRQSFLYGKSAAKLRWWIFGIDEVEKS